MQLIILALGMAILVASAYCDVQMRRIPNVLTYSLAVLGVLHLIVLGDPSATGWTLASAAAVLVVGFLLFWGGFFGGGEAKLLTAPALLIEYDGGRWLRRVVRPAAVRPVDEGPAAEARPTAPYGIAIAMGAVMMLLYQALAST